MRAVVLVMLLLTAPALAQSTSKIQIRDAWARLPESGVQTTTAYGEIVNLSADPDVLLGASSPWAGKIVIQHYVMEGYNMAAKIVPSVKIGARDKVTLGPGDYHLKLEGLTQVLKPDMLIPIDLRFEKAGRVEMQASVSNQKLGNLDQR
jgi:copper(I)-binding protein